MHPAPSYLPAPTWAVPVMAKPDVRGPDSTVIDTNFCRKLVRTQVGFIPTKPTIRNILASAVFTKSVSSFSLTGVSAPGPVGKRAFSSSINILQRLRRLSISQAWSAFANFQRILSAIPSKSASTVDPVLSGNPDCVALGDGSMRPRRVPFDGRSPILLTCEKAEPPQHANQQAYEWHGFGRACQTSPSQLCGKIIRSFAPTAARVAPTLVIRLIRSVGPA